MSYADTRDQIMRCAMRLIGALLVRGRLRIEVAGLRHVPARGAGIVIARHYHHLFDGVVLHWTIPRRIHLLATLDWATDPLTRYAMTALLRAARWPVVLRADAIKRQLTGHDPGKKKAFTAADLRRYRRQALRDSIMLLCEERLLVIFPEGYPNVDPHYTPKTADDQMLPFKSGFAVIAAAAERRLGTRIPIIPAGLQYTAGKRWTAKATFGNPLFGADFATTEALVKRLEQDVAALSKLPSQKWH